MRRIDQSIEINFWSVLYETKMEVLNYKVTKKDNWVNLGGGKNS